MISLGRVAVPSPKIVINLPGTYKKISCKGELDRFSGYEILRYIKTKRQTNIQTSCCLNVRNINYKSFDEEIKEFIMSFIIFESLLNVSKEIKIVFNRFILNGLKLYHIFLLSIYIN